MIHDIINLWVPSGFAILAAVAFAWATYTERKATRFICPGSVWKKKHGTTSVVVLQLNRDEGQVAFAYRGFSSHRREMSWSSFLALYELEAQPYEATQSPVALDHFGMMAPPLNKVEQARLAAMDQPKSEGRHLDALAEMLGMERRWWGWEPDWLLARRLFKGMKK